MDILIYIVKAFSKDKSQGNPAGVVLHADALSEKEMQSISATLGFSESAFVSTSNIADRKVRFFSPDQEVGICAHATIAAVYVLLYERIITLNGKDAITLTLEVKSGVFPVTCYSDGLIVMEQKAPEFMIEERNRKYIADLLSISQNDLADYPIQSVSTGTPKLMIPVNSLESLLKIHPDVDGIKEYCQSTGTRGFYPFTFETTDPTSDIHARQFNPLAGINEDPITGIAAGALGCYLVEHKISTNKKFTIEQGYIMNKAGKVYVDVSNGVKVGGYAVIAREENCT